MEFYDFYREGFLNKAGKGIIQTRLHSWRPRYFVLNDLKLKYYKSKEQLPENLLGCIEVSQMESVSTMKNEKRAFQITTKSPKKRTYYMSGRSEEEIQGWITCLKMAKEKCEAKKQKDRTPDDVPVVSNYSELFIPPSNTTPPVKPARSLIVSGQGFLEASPSAMSTAEPISENSPGTEEVSSEYETVNMNVGTKVNTKQEEDEKLYQDPTYDSVDENAVSMKNKLSNKNSEPDEAADLYDTYDTVLTATTKKSTRLSDPTPLATVPPPLPARLPSMPGGALPEECATPQGNEISQESKNGQENPIGIYDEIGSPTMENLEEMKIEPPSEPIHVYAKPQKSMKKKNSKRKLIPGLMDVGEVDIDIEQDAAGGKKILEQGMTKPMGDRFAIDDLREVLAEYDQEMNNNEDGKMVADFDVNQSESAFDVLKMFLLKYQ